MFARYNHVHSQMEAISPLSFHPLNNSFTCDFGFAWHHLKFMIKWLHVQQSFELKQQGTVQQMCFFKFPRTHLQIGTTSWPVPRSFNYSCTTPDVGRIQWYFCTADLFESIAILNFWFFIICAFFFSFNFFGITNCWLACFFFFHARWKSISDTSINHGSFCTADLFEATAKSNFQVVAMWKTTVKSFLL